MTAPEPPAVPDREARRARRDAEWARRDAEAEQRARLDARIDAAAAAAPSVLPGGVGETLAAVLAAMKPFRAADGHLSLSAVGRSSDEVVALAEAILALPADAVRLVPDAELERLREIEAALRAWMVTPGRKQTADDVGRAHRRLVASLRTTQAVPDTGQARVPKQVVARALDSIGEIVEALECACPDAHIKSACFVPYCPQHTIGPRIAEAVEAALHGLSVDTGQACEPGAESRCLCGPDLTGECIDSRPDCPRHGYDYSVSGMVTAPELARAWWDSLEGDRPFWESLDQSAQAGYVELAAKWIQRACRNTAEVTSGGTVQASDGPPASFWDESGSTSPVIDWSPVQAPDVAALLPVVRAAIAYHESTGPSRGDDAEDELLDRVAELPADVRALLGTDTTPEAGRG